MIWIARLLALLQALLALLTMSLALWYSPTGPQWLLKSYFAIVSLACLIGVWIGWPRKP